MTPPKRQIHSVMLLVVLTALCVGRSAAQKGAMRDPQPANIPPRTFALTDFGAKGDGTTLNTEAFRAAIQACAKAGGGRVTIPAGTFVTGPIELASHTALVLSKGAVIQASGKFSDYGLPDPLPATQPELDALKKQVRPLITGANLEDVAILGEGTIDGGGAAWWARSDKSVERAAAAAPAADSHTPPAPKPLAVPRTYLVTLHKCTRVHLQGVTLQNSPMFHLVPSQCQEVLIEDVTITSPADSPNTDGIDPGNCRNVLIRRCTIDTGDDNIAIKSGSHGASPTENITVTDCKFLHGHGVSIGSETEAGVHNFLVEHCTFENTGTALRIKSGRTRGGLIENVAYRDITMKHVETAITIFLFYDDKSAALRPELKPVTEETPMVRGVRFLNITCDGTTRKAGDITGLPESPVTDVSLENVHITNAAAPFTQQDVKNLRFLNVDVQTVAPAPPAPPNPPTPR